MKRVLLPIIDGLREVHAAGFLHRDIKPSNIFVRRSDESPVLLDFGAARQALGRHSRNLTGVVTAGYSPPEQYERDGDQGPWTDVYALSALCYEAIAGESPPEAPRRLNRLAQGEPDPLRPLAGLAPAGFSKALLGAVDRGLEIAVAKRPANLDDWLVGLTGPGAVADPPDPPAPPRRRRGGAWVATFGTALAVVAGGWLWLEFGGGAFGPDDPAPRLVRPEEPVPDPEQSRPPGAVAVTGGGALLVVKTEPAGAEVLIGDTLVGETPLERSDIQAGAHRITVRHGAYREEALDREFADGVVTDVELTLRRGTGRLTVVTEPRGAWIEHGGERLAEGTPVTLANLPAGTVALRIGADEHGTAEVRAEVPKDGVGMLERTLVRIPHGTLTLDVVPPDASVTLPDIGPAYRAGMRLPEGPHRVAVRRDGYREATRTVAVAGDTRERIELVLNPQPFAEPLRSGGEGRRWW